jgi:hypothetical protein
MAFDCFWLGDIKKKITKRRRRDLRRWTAQQHIVASITIEELFALADRLWARGLIETKCERTIHHTCRGGR